MVSLIRDESNLETFSLVWLDVSVQNAKENILIEQRFRSLINSLKIFDDVGECEKYIRSMSKQDRIVLVVNDRLGCEITPHIHEFRHVFSIYIYCRNEMTDVKWTEQFSKVNGVIGDLDKLVIQIRSDQPKQNYHNVNEPFAITVFNTKFDHEQSTTELNGQFINSQLLIDCLLGMNSSLTDKNELISVCREEYKGNMTELAIFNEFEDDYSSDRSLWWYTRESFVYRLLNKALRVQNIDLLFLFKFIIRDLYQKLQQHQCSSPIRVFRGQLISKEELQILKNSLGEFISMNSFLSTSIDRAVAVFSLGSLTTPTDDGDDLQRVLFEIDADPCLDKVKPFANITSFSYFSYEQEVLMMLGSIFRLVDIRRDNDRLWIIRMVLCSNNDHDLKSIFDRMKKGEFDSSLAWHHKSLEMKMRARKSNDSELANSYLCIGTVHRKKGNLNEAFEIFNKALTICTRTFGEDHLDVAMCYCCMGDVYQREDNYSKALECHKRALTIRKKHLPASHPHLGGSHNNIASAYRCLENLHRALDHSNVSLKIYQKSLSSRHCNIGRVFENLGHIYIDKGDLTNALLYLDKAAIIYRETRPSNHPFIIKIEHSIRRISSQS